ncbi:MAG: sulfatase-like hydrolase/transferase [Spirochaetes bacterium]|nr:sulfatase-like hydrolase/transferase [Spirochaetota bacterium]
MDRRSFLSTAAAITAGALASRLFSQTSGKKPNILMIPVDDLKPLMGCYGDNDILTPNIDRLAARGTVFLNNCCQQAVCGPTRASLMTGMYPDHTGVWDLETRMRDVNPDILALPQYLISQGYETTGIGKTYDYRCVDNKADEPSWSIPYGTEKVMVDQTLGPTVGGYRNPETIEAMKKGNEALKGQKFKSGSAKTAALAKIAGPLASPATECTDVPDNAYYDGALAEAGCRQLETLSSAGKPFFLSVGFQKPHLPFIAPKKYWDMYDRSKIKIHPFQEKAKNSPEIAYHTSGELRSFSDIPDVGELTAEMQLELIHGYRACVSYVDAQIGKLLKKLDDLGIADNTIVCLWGDHGWHLGDHGLWCKHSNFENAARAPLIITAPGKPKGNKTNSPTGFVDVFPTLCDLAGLAVPAHLHGKSLAPVMDNPKAAVRDAILSQYPRTIDNKPVMGYTLRDERYRYVKWLQMDYRKGARAGLLVANELYDYQNDPLETVSQSQNTEYKPIVDRFEAFFKKMNVAQHTREYGKTAADAVTHGVGPVLLNGDGKFCVCKTVTVEGQPFAEAHEVTVAAKPEKISDAAYKRMIMLTLEPEKKYRISFYCRSDGGGEFNAIFQKNGAPYTKLADAAVKADASWKKIELTAVMKESFKPGGAVLTCHIGTKPQTILFADVRAELI